MKHMIHKFIHNETFTKPDYLKKLLIVLRIKSLHYSALNVIMNHSCEMKVNGDHSGTKYAN